MAVLSRHRRIVPASRPQPLAGTQQPDGAGAPDPAPSGHHRPDHTPLVLTILGAAVVTIALLLDPTPAAQTLLGVGLALSAGGPLVRIADHIQRRTPAAQPQDDDGQDDGEADRP